MVGESLGVTKLSIPKNTFNGAVYPTVASS